VVKVAGEFSKEELVVGAVAVSSKLAAEAFAVKRPFYADDAVAAESLEEFQIRFEIGFKDLAEAARMGARS